MNLVMNQFKPMINSRFGKESTAVWKAAKEQTRAVKAEYPGIRKDIQMVIYPIAGLYKAMQNYVSKEDARKYMIEFAPVPGTKLKNFLLFLTGFPGVSAYMWKNVDSIMRKSGSEAKGYKSRFYGKHGNEAAMDVLECPLYEAFKTMGIPEIATVVCEMYLIYSNGYKGIEFSRTKALANGDSCCDYRYSRRHK